MFNQKGQSFATFRLLISAIVAIAILTILFQILGLIQLPGQGDPDVKAAELITSQINKPGSPKTTDSAVQFSRDNSILRNALASSTRAGLSASQICVHPGALSGSFGDVDSGKLFTGALGKSITYKGGSPRSVKMTVLCDEKRLFADPTDDASAFSTVEYLIDEWATDCDGVFDDVEDTTTVCAVFLRTA